MKTFLIIGIINIILYVVTICIMNVTRKIITGSMEVLKKNAMIETKEPEHKNESKTFKVKMSPPLMILLSFVPIINIFLVIMNAWFLISTIMLLIASVNTINELP